MSRRQRRVGLLAALLVVAGCAAAPAREEQARVEEDIETILTQPLDASEYGEPRRCLPAASVRDFEALDDRRILFRASGGQLWLNQLRGSCPDLRFRSALVFERGSLQVCNLDQFEVRDWDYWPRYRRWPWDWWKGVPCTLGSFQPVSAEQADAIRAALRRD